MAPRMSLLPLICSLSGDTLMVSVSTGKCMASGVTMAVTLFASRSRIACASSGCSRASPYLHHCLLLGWCPAALCPFSAALAFYCSHAEGPGCETPGTLLRSALLASRKWGHRKRPASCHATVMLQSA